MKIKEIKKFLCYYDLRNPDGVNSCGLLSKQEINEEGYINSSKENCSCDNCFYSRTELAVELLKIYNKL